MESLGLDDLSNIKKKKKKKKKKDIRIFRHTFLGNCEA